MPHLAGYQVSHTTVRRPRSIPAYAGRSRVDRRPVDALAMLEGTHNRKSPGEGGRWERSLE